MPSYAHRPSIYHGAVSDWRGYQREQHKDNGDLRCLDGCHIHGIFHLDSSTGSANPGHPGCTSLADEPRVASLCQICLIIRQNYARKP